jgi:hypothetical protein
MRLGLAPRSCRTNSLGGNLSPPLWGTVQRGRCQPRDAAPPTPVRLNAPSPRRGADRTLDLLSRDLAGLGCGVRPVGSHPCHCPRHGGRPRAYKPTPGTVATAPTLWSVRERNAALPATVPRTDRHQQLPRARLKTSRPSAALLPSMLPLFGYKIRHDGRIAARTVKAAAHSTA